MIETEIFSMVRMYGIGRVYRIGFPNIRLKAKRIVRLGEMFRSTRVDFFTFSVPEI